MPLPTDSDPTLDSLRDDLRAQLAALNDLYHPVYPASPKRIAEIERLVQDLHESISARRKELAAFKPAATVAAIPAAPAPAKM